MGPEYYDHATFPSQGAAGSSAAMRSELELIEAGFGKLPTIAGNGGKVLAVNAGATALEAITTTGTGDGVRATSPTLVTPALGAATATTVNKITITQPATGATLTLVEGSTLATSGAYSATLTMTGATNVTLPTTGTLATLAGAETLTNKTINLTSNTLAGTKAQFNAALSDGDFAEQSEIQNQTYTAFTTAGTATAYTLTPSPALAALAAGQRFRVKFNAANTSTTPTLAISGLAAKAIKVYNTAGLKIDPVVGGLALDMLADVEYDGTDYVVFDALKTTATTALPTVTATVAADALTLGMAAKPLDFRSATLASGAVTTLLAKPANIVVPSGATLGTVDAKKNRLVVGVMNVDGVAELFVINAILGNYLDESRRITTTVLDAASDSAEVPYSTTARTDMPFRILGYVESTQATAGTWATAPTLIQGIGAKAEIVQQVAFRAYQSTTQAVAANTFTKVLFQSENYDIGGNFASSAFTAPSPGLYTFSAAVPATPADGQRCLLTFYVNGAESTRVFDFSIGAASSASCAGSGTLRLVAGDVVEAFIYYSVAEDTVIGTTITYFSGHRIG